MADPLNPYAPPHASLDPQGPESLWRDGNVLVMRPGSTLPPRCVKCNEPAELPLKPRKVYWHQPWVYILLLNLLVYALVALILRKRAVLAPGLCPRHRRHRWFGIALGWGGSLCALGLMYLGATQDIFALVVLGLTALLGSVIAGVILARVVNPSRIDKDFVRLRGCGQAFLESLPPFHG